MERPASPEFIPTKTGIDRESQVYPGDLFHFDDDVSPILDVLVGKTLEQALLEVMEDEELEVMRSRQQEFEQRRNTELAETQRMEEVERRLEEEKERRLKEERERLERELAVKEKVAARGFAQVCLGDLMSSVFGNLKKSGYFYDTVEREVETQFVPWMLTRIEGNIQRRHIARRLVDNLLHSALQKGVNQHLNARRKEREDEMARRRQALADWEEEVERIKSGGGKEVARAEEEEEEEAEGDEEEEYDEEG